MKNTDIKILSLHWGMSIGGVGKYASIIDGVINYWPINIKSFCILSTNRQVDKSTIDQLSDKTEIWRSGISDLVWLWRLKAEIQNWKPVFIMTHGFNGHFVAILLKTLFNIDVPLICSYHGEYHATTAGRRLLEIPYNLFTEWVIRKKTTGTITVANFCKQHLISKNINPDKIKVIHNGITDSLSMNNSGINIRQEWDVKEDEILIGIASRLDPVKGITYLLDTFINMSAEFKKIKLVIVGTGSLDKELKKNVTDVGLNKRVIFTGFRTDIKECLSAFDIFVLPSLAESHSIALLEAMRSGKAIVATDVGGNTESVRNEEEALVVPAADSEALYESIGRLVKDSNLRTNLGQNARNRFLENFTIEHTVNKTAQWIIDIAYSF